MQKTKKGFTILADLREMKSPPDPVKKLHEKAQKVIINSGVSKLATLITSSLIKISVNSICNESGMNVLLQNFNNAKEAEKWLDE